MKTKYRYYSQHGEDFLLWKLFGYKEKGFYVDVGAFDGVHLSNTFSFEQQGWTGICIEAHPEYYQICKRSRLRSTCLHTACVARDDMKTTDFYVEELGLFSGIQEDRIDDVQAKYKTQGLLFKGFSKSAVPASTLNAILSKHVSPGVEIDFISVDVEGTELEVLKGLDLSRLRPRVMVIETNTDETRGVINAHMVELNGYIQARRLGVNTIYVRDPENAEELQSIAISCRIEKSLHPLGEKHTIESHLEGKEIHQIEELEQIREERNRLKGERQMLIRQRDTLLNSLSWKITAPLRWLGKIAKGLGR